MPDLKIDRIEYPELQKAIKPDMDARSVRLDVYVKDNKNTVYDIEMQVSNTKELPERSRYYQSMIVLQLFLNANGTQNDVSRELKVFLDYVAGRKSEDSFVEKLEEAVREAKRNREWRHEYMTLLMRDRENVEKGEERLAEEKPDGSDRRKF